MQNLIIIDENENYINMCDLGFCIQDRPDIPTPKQKVEFIEIPGRDGSLTVEGGHQNINIKVKLNVMEDNIIGEFRKTKSILLDATRIVFSDDNDVCYIVKAVEIGDIVNEVDFYGSFDVTFTVDPFAYSNNTFIYTVIKKGIDYTTTTNLCVNGYISKPLIRIRTNSLNPYFEINNNKIQIITSSKEIYIDCENMTCYDNQGNNLLGLMNGDFFELKKGIHKLSFALIDEFAIQLREGWR